MTYRGRVQNGVVVFEGNLPLEEGTVVRVEPEAKETASRPQRQETTLGQRLLRFAGTVPGLPADMAKNHDHYIHGTPKKL